MCMLCPQPDLSMLTYLAKALLLQSLAVPSPVSVFSDKGSSSLASNLSNPMCQTFMSHVSDHVLLISLISFTIIN